jgi:16S rRNA processing protein RimM
VREYYLIAKILSASGNEGFVNIVLFTDFPRRLFKLKKVYIDFFDDKKEFTIDKVKRSNGNFQVKFKNFNNENDIGILIEKNIFIDKDDLTELPDDEYYIHDLLGSVVLRNNVEIGMIKDVLSLPANDVYVIEDEQGKEILIPAVHDYIESFNPEKKILLLKPGEDLYDSDED